MNVNAASVESDMYMKALIIEEVTPNNVTLVVSNSIPKPWAINLGCTSHFALNRSDFVSYIPYTELQVVHMGDAHGTPSLGEGTIWFVTTGSPHSQNSSPTTGLGLSLEAGPSVTGV